MSAYTGKLKHEGHYILDEDGGAIGVFGGTDLANARRLVACWNYCIGMSTEHLEAGDDWKAEALALVAHGHVVSAVKHCRAKTGWGLKQAVDEVKALQTITPITNEHAVSLVKERDELVNALRMCADYLPELIGAWDWKNGVLAGGADVEYQTLVDDSNSAYAILAKYQEAS